MTLLEELIERYPNAPWNWSQLSMNNAISFKFVLEHRSLPWNIYNISRNISITKNDIEDNPDFAWSLSGLIYNINLDYDFFYRHIISPVSVVYIDWNALSANPSIKTIDIIEHPSHPWNDYFLSANPNISSNFILNEGRNRSWFAPSVSANPGITKRDIVKSTLKSIFSWNYRNLSINPNLPLIYVQNNLQEDWNWFELSKRVSMTDMERFHIFKWNDIGLSMNANISMNYILNNDKYKWNKEMILYNSAITISDIEDNIEWFDIPIIEMKKTISLNPNITYEWIEDNFKYIDWDKLSINPLM